MKDVVHVTLDIETLGVAPGSVIMQIGAVCLNPKLADQPIEFSATINLASCKGFDIHFGIVFWWMKQKDEARESVFANPDAMLLLDALIDFNYWLRSCTEAQGKLYLWGYGSNFDNTLLTAAFDKMYLTPGWTYKNDMCMRTLAALFPGTPRILPSPAKAHIAIHDARAQAEWLSNLLYQISGTEVVRYPPVEMDDDPTF